MGVQKFRRVEDMPELWLEAGDPRIVRKFQAACQTGADLAGSLRIPRGVRKFRSIDDLAADREQFEDARIARLHERPGK